MKFPVVPQSMIAVVSMIWWFTDIFMGMRKVLSFGKAVSTWLIWEDDIETSSLLKNPGVLRRSQRLSLPHWLLHSKASRFGGVLPPIFPGIGHKRQKGKGLAWWRKWVLGSLRCGGFVAMGGEDWTL